MINLEMFGFRAMWSPYLFCITAVITGVYFYWCSRHKGRVSAKEKVLFVLSALFFYAAAGSPVDLLGHVMFSAHMTQMAVLFLVVPPLLISGIPGWAWKKLIFRPVVKPLFSFFSMPLIALVLFNGIFSLYHIPFIFDFVKTDSLYHTLMNGLIFVTAFFMWWPLVHKVDGLPRLSGLMKLGYIMADGILLTPACALIMFSGAPMYATYTDPAAWAEAMKLCVPLDLLEEIPLSGPEMLTRFLLWKISSLGQY